MEVADKADEVVLIFYNNILNSWLPVFERKDEERQQQEKFFFYSLIIICQRAQMFH
jgi:hypothetical protein